jgi:hypothetical protein
MLILTIATFIANLFFWNGNKLAQGTAVFYSNGTKLGIISINNNQSCTQIPLEWSNITFHRVGPHTTVHLFKHKNCTGKVDGLQSVQSLVIKKEQDQILSRAILVGDSLTDVFLINQVGTKRTIARMGLSASAVIAGQNVSY